MDADENRDDAGRPAGAAASGSAPDRDGIRIVRLQRAHWPAVAEIYGEGIRTGHATFETAVPTWEEWDRGHLDDHRLVAVDDEEVVLGWAALTRVSIREVYRGVAECSVYVGKEARGEGVGESLLEALTHSADRDDIWTIEAIVFTGNEASVAMLEACGFRVVGRRERLGKRDGRWHDVLLLERRRAAD